MSPPRSLWRDLMRWESVWGGSGSSSTERERSWGPARPLLVGDGPRRLRLPAGGEYVGENPGRPAGAFPA